MSSETKNADFEKALEFVLQWETVFAKGHYGDYDFAITELDPADPGGATKFGLDSRTHGNGVSTLTLSKAKEIYKNEYWDRCKCYKLPWPLSFFLFDSAVNVGYRQATLWFQRAAGASDDGVWGPKTDLQVNEWIDDVGKQECLKQLVEMREEFYKRLNKPKFEQGWLNRTAALLKKSTTA